MLTERSIINFLIWVGGLIVGPYLAAASFSNDPGRPINPGPLVTAAAICFVVFMFGVGKDKLCALPLLGTFIGGKLTFVPLKLAPSEICAVALIVYYLIRYTALQRKKMHTGPLIYFIPIFAIAAILLYHEPGFGMKSMGGGREGGRGAVLILVASITYLCGVSVNSPSPKFMARVPFYCVGLSILFAIPYYATTYFPSTAPYFYQITDNINGSSYANAMRNDDGIVRNTAQAYTGSAVLIWLLSYFPIGTWWRPNNWWILAVAGLSLAMVVMGGFRSMLATCGLAALAAIWCYYSWRAVLLIPPMILGIFILVVLQDDHLVQLPLSAQRSLAFIPGNWSPDVVESTLSSNQFRDNIEHVYITEYLDKSPLLGNGLSYDSNEFQKYRYLSENQETPDGYYQSKLFVTGKMYHTGWISLYDTVGLIGSAIFVILGLALIWKSGQMVFGENTDRKSPLFPFKVWLLCNILPMFIGFFTVFGDIRGAFPSMCYFAILWTHLHRLEVSGYKEVPRLREVPFDAERSGLQVPA